LSAKKVIQSYLPPVREKSSKGDGGNKILPIVLQNIKTEVFKKCDKQTEKNLENKLLKLSDQDIIPVSLKKYFI